MAANREMEEPNIKVSDSVPALCASLPAPVPAARPADGSDPKASGGSCDRRSSSAASPERPDPATRASGAKRPREATRCSGSGCRKRVELIGFRCRCGYVFCSEHRYSDRHDCSYDYKAAGREAIARENPVVRAAKLLKV